MATAKKILKLNTLTIEDNFFENVALIGISSDRPIYTICHILNKTFTLNFLRKPLLDVAIGKKSEAFSFAIYQSAVQRSDDCYTLYKLRVGDVHLLPSIGNVDYIWMFKSDEAENIAIHYLKIIRNLPEIQFATLLEKDKIKNIDYLIL